MKTLAPSEEDDRESGRRARAVLGLGIVGVSVALALAQLAVRDVGAFVTQNVLPPAQRKGMLGLLAGAFVLVAAAIAVIWRRSPPGLATGRLDRAARLSAPLALAAAVPGLFAMNPWTDTLMLAVTLGAFALAIEPLWRLHFGAYRTAPAPAGTATAPRALPPLALPFPTARPPLPPMLASPPRPRAPGGGTGRSSSLPPPSRRTSPT